MAPIFERLVTLLVLLPAITSALLALTLCMNDLACRSPIASRTTPSSSSTASSATKTTASNASATGSKPPTAPAPRASPTANNHNTRRRRPVLAETGARNVDLIGHPEGDLQSFYVPKFEGSVKNKIRNIAALAPVSHGTTLHGINKIAYGGGLVTVSTIDQILTTGGCEACIDLRPDGATTVALNTGPLVQKFVDKVLIIATEYDARVTPVGTRSFINEPKVTNTFIQDPCPTDTAEYHNIANNPNAWGLVANFLDASIPVTSVCVVRQTPLKN